MSRVDELTGRKPLYGNNRSKALNITKRRWNLNLQPLTIVVNGKKQKVMVSAKTMRTLKNKGTLK